MTCTIAQGWLRCASWCGQSSKYSTAWAGSQSEASSRAIAAVRSMSARWALRAAPKSAALVLLVSVQARRSRSICLQGVGSLACSNQCGRAWAIRAASL